MTPANIPPCPVCGAKPKWNADRTQLVGNPECNGCDGDNQGFRRKANALLASALRTHGIHTLAELESRLAPDPRVAELRGYITVLLDLAADAANGLGYVRDVHGDLYGVGFDRVKIKAGVLPVIRLKMSQLIAAQRGEE